MAADVAGRAMRLIADGLVDREGVDGLARRVGYTPRHLGRLLTQRARRRAAGARPGPARADRAGAHRDHRPADHRRRVRRRVRQRAPVQRDGPRGLRHLAEPAPRAPALAACPRHPGSAHHAAGGAHPVRRLAAARLPRLPPRARCRGGLRRHLRPHPRPAARPRHRPAAPGRPAGRQRHRLRRVPSSGCTTCATPPPPASAYAGCWTPTATPARSTPTSAPTPRSASWCAPPRDCASRARSTATRRPCAPSSASR